MLTLTKRLWHGAQRRLCRLAERAGRRGPPVSPSAAEPRNCLGDDLDPKTLALMKLVGERGAEAAGLRGDDEAQIFELAFWRGVAFHGYQQVAPRDFPAFQRDWMLSCFVRTGWSVEDFRDSDLAEIGCGPLGMIEFLPGRRKVAFDPLNDHYARLFRRARSGAVRYHSRLDDLLPAETGAFDLAICFNVLDHTRSARKLFDSFMALVKPGGRFLLEVNTVRPGAERSAEHARMHPSPLAVETVRSWVAEYSGRCQDYLCPDPTGLNEYFFMSFGYKDRRMAQTRN
jgi:SAM-dependent methyltransferase